MQILTSEIQKTVSNWAKTLSAPTRPKSNVTTANSSPSFDKKKGKK